MREEKKVDFGSIQIHREALADLVSSAVSEVEGIRLLPKNFFDKLSDAIGRTQYPGVVVHIDQNNEVVIEVKILVKFGMNIHDLARQAQDVVKTTIERTVNLTLKDINVNIIGIERGET